jgi:hypothetical protein
MLERSQNINQTQTLIQALLVTRPHFVTSLLSNNPSNYNALLWQINFIHPNLV